MLFISKIKKVFKFKPMTYYTCTNQAFNETNNKTLKISLFSRTATIIIIQLTKSTTMPRRNFVTSNPSNHSHNYPIQFYIKIYHDLSSNTLCQQETFQNTRFCISLISHAPCYGQILSQYLFSFFLHDLHIHVHCFYNLHTLSPVFFIFIIFVILFSGVTSVTISMSFRMMSFW